MIKRGGKMLVLGLVLGLLGLAAGLMVLERKLGLLGPAAGLMALERKDVDAMHKWDLSPLFSDLSAFKKAKAGVLPEAEKIRAYAGRLGESAQTLKEALDITWGVELRLRHLESYSSRLSDQDTRDSKTKALSSEVQQLRTRFAELTSFIDPEIIAIPEETLKGFFEQEPGLKIYERPIAEALRRKKHILSPREERILAAASDIAMAGHSTYRLFTNADLPRESIILSDGKEITLTDATYVKYRRAPVKADRDLIASTFYKQYQKFRRSVGEMLYTQMKAHLFYSKMRGYDDTLSASLDRDDIDTVIYSRLIEMVHKNLPTFHRYLKLKARARGVERLDYQDLYVPFTREMKIEVSYDRAMEILLESLAPLGEEYLGRLKEAFTKGWIDVYPTEGKQSGAYSSGWAYGVHPFVLMNYNNEYSDALTLAHEVGHAMHSLLSNEANALPTSDYAIFVAEVASTFNENLLNDAMLRQVKSDEEKIYLLGNFLDGTIKGTFFRQVQFAEFEWLIHQRVEKGEALTGEKLSEIYLDLVRRYYGHDEGVCHVPDYFAEEWAYIPHFYYNYYVFQYSTSVAAASSLSRKVIDKVPGALERYMGLLKAGNTKDPVSILRDAGVDMTKPEAYEALMERANGYMDELEKIFDAR